MIQPRTEVLHARPAVHGGPAGADDERHAVRVDFSASLNAWGPAPSVRRAAAEAAIEDYPDPESLRPRRAAAAKWNVPVESVIFGAGSAELIHALCFAYLRPGDGVLVPGPTFGGYARAAALCGALVRHQGAAPPHWRLDAGEIVRGVAEHGPVLVFLCTPNNPSGQALGPGDVRAVADACAAAGALLVLDQAYDAFAPEPLGMPALPGHAAVLHLRSITKDHAIAGLRAAFAVGPRPVVEALALARVSWAASAPAQAAAVAALGGEADAHLASTIPRLREERARLERACAALGIETVPSDTHYFLARVPGAPGVHQRLRTEFGIKVRHCASFGLPGHLRMAARTPAENDLLNAALEAVCRG